MVGVALAFALTGCGQGPVSVEPPEPSGAAKGACRALIDDLPANVGGGKARRVEPPEALAAAWGDPPITLRCGVARPEALTPTSECFEINGVGWYAEKATRGTIFTTVGRATYVEVAVPEAYDPAADSLVDLASSVDRRVRQVKPCQ
ncbi:DUF3515 domain-containing protein [Actinopolymorpha sp. B17G11]|uniref:DUF3515 domain-containing protein n=1 Tax=unclassified Actinopolymorpha TaxID=2627063 RepID=UPI0032D94481